MESPTDPKDGSPSLIRGMGLGSATALNMIDMIGVGPFITMPLVLSAMGGPQAMLGWVVGALLAVCDGLVSAELGAAFPGSGGSYRYLSEIYGPRKWGRLISFLFIWQLSFSAPLSIATGCIGLVGYAAYYWPSLETVYAAHTATLQIPWAGPLQVSWLVTQGTAFAVIICFLTVLLLYRRITVIGRLSNVLWLGVMGTIGWIIFAGLTHFNAARAFDFPPGAFSLSRGFFTGLGGAMLVATYDYWGYYNVCYLGDEIKDPTRNIPRALLLSILLVACLYLMMNLCILAVIPWREMLQAGHNNSGLYVVSLFMQRIYGPWAARLVTGLVIVTAFASVFSLTLGYSRVPYAAALDGNYFKAFAKSASGLPLPACFAAGAWSSGGGILLSASARRDRRSRGDSPNPAISGAGGRVDGASGDASRYTAPISDVALSCARSGGYRRISVYSVQSRQLAEGNSLCGGDIVGGPYNLYDSRVERAGVALQRGSVLIHLEL